MAELTYQQRKNLPKSEFAVPSERRFPIPDKAHARNALARLSQAKGLSEAEKKKIKAMAYAKLGKRVYSKEAVAHAQRMVSKG